LSNARPDLSWISKAPIAHRGLHDESAGRLENTRAAFAAALDHGFAIELDVQRTADGEAVVFHDFTLERLGGRTEQIAHCTAAALAGIELFGSADRIETLPAILAQIGGKVPVVIEIKSAFDQDRALLRRVIAVVESYSGPFVLKSFDPDVVIALREEAPHLPRGIVSMSEFEDDKEIRHLSRMAIKAMEQLWHFSATMPDFISWHASDLPTAGTSVARALGKPLMGWTVRSQKKAELVKPFLDQIIFEGFMPERAE
jgi:glycerophosphoryl diester phosphodiesterase